MPTPKYLRAGVALAACCLYLAVGLALAASVTAPAPAFRKLQLSDTFFSEGSIFADLNRDQRPDAVAGPYWYEGPDFKKRHEIYPPFPFDPLKYSDNFLTFAHDFNGDSWMDVLVLGFPGHDASWYENPGAKGGNWRRHPVFMPVDNESPTFGELLTSGKPVLVCSSGGRLGYAVPDPADPLRPWVFHAISPPGPWQRFTHGLGFGDINGDGRRDLLTSDGWWEQPASLTGDPLWTKHPFAFAPGRGGAQLHAYDVNGDGLVDVVTARDAHGYGLSWFEQVRGTDGRIDFREHAITSIRAEEQLGGVQFSQLHALALADVDGDGLEDLVTGKRWWAHGPTGDVDPGAAPVVYAFLLRRGPDHTASFVPQLIDDASGIGTQVVAADVNGDGRSDVLSANKRGAFVFLSQGPPAKK